MSAPEEAGSTESANDKYDDSLGANATKLFGSFVGMTLFAGILIAYGLSSKGESPFPAIREMKQLSSISAAWFATTVRFVFLLVLIAHHWRVFAGIAFAEDDKTFTDALDTMEPEKKRTKLRIFRFLKLFFLITYPLFVLSFRLEPVFFFKTVFFLQTAASIIFDCYFRKEMKIAEKEKTKYIFLADFSFFSLAIFLFFIPMFPNADPFKFAGGVVLFMCIMVGCEASVYGDAIQRMWSRMGKYLAVENHVNPSA